MYVMGIKMDFFTHFMKKIQSKNVQFFLIPFFLKIATKQLQLLILSAVQKNMD